MLYVTTVQENEEHIHTMFPGNIETSRYKLRRFDRLLASKMREKSLQLLVDSQAIRRINGIARWIYQSNVTHADAHSNFSFPLCYDISNIQC